MKNFRERTFVFGCRCWSGFFLVLFCLCFCFIVRFFAPETVLEKFYLCQVWCFGFFFLSSFGFFFSPTSSSFCVFVSFFFSREKAQVVTGHTPTRTCVFFLFFLCPRRNWFVLPFWPCVLSFWRFVGVPFWAPGVFGFSRDFSEAFFSDARRQGCFSASCVLFCFSPFRSVLRPRTFSRSPSRLSSRSGQPRVGFLSRKGHNIGWSRPPLARVRARGSASRAEGWSSPVSGFLTASFGSHRVTGTPWAFLYGEGAFYLPPQALFHTHLSFVSPPQVFFYI